MQTAHGAHMHRFISVPLSVHMDNENAPALTNLLRRAYHSPFVGPTSFGDVT